MRGRVGVVVLVLGLFAAGLAAGAIQAGSTAPPTTTAETTTEPSTTQETTTAPPVSTTTTVPSTTTAAPASARNVLAAGPIESGRCVLVAAFVLLEPNGQVRVLGPAAQSPHAHDVAASSVAYPGDGTIVTASVISLHAGGCGGGRAVVSSLSLFGGAITARSVGLGAHGNVVGKGLRIEGLTIGGKSVTLQPGRWQPVGSWGSATALARPNGTEAGALAVHLTTAHAGLAADTMLLVSFAQAPRPAAKAAIPTVRRRAAKRAAHANPRVHAQRKAKPRKRHRHRVRKHLGDEPLKMTPPLGLSRYVFPVAGESDYIDTYGAFRGDVPGNWHHGDDVFAGLGTPVVAVADGTLNRVGWERLGGWRLWVRDGMRNEFYYAHLSGYSPLALHSKHVQAGDVIGFIGNTGDAFTTSPHLHFEIHPHQLLRLDYNGAVNPTRYLDEWQHLAHLRAPKPAHPAFPSGVVRAEARFVWRRLLAARGLISHAPRLSERPRIATPAPDHAPATRRVAAAADLHAGHASGVRPLDVLLGLIAPALLFGSVLLLRLRRKPS
jgi:murein DD-endopeptidase MepM/ murein hydrolase activator NlpD